MPFDKKTASKAGANSKRGKGKRTEAWEALGAYFTSTGASRAMRIMSQADDDQFMEYYSKLIELFRPKLARTEIDAGENAKVKFTVSVTRAGN